MNDPNGMIREGDVYHLFFQHDPDSISHGPMHWGHAISRDLVDWEERPVALYPDHLGTCFSGCAVRAADGVKLFYTAHSLTAAGRDFQVQCLAHANEDMTGFATDAGNPVIANPGNEVFRDPKVIWHNETSRWIMLLTEGQSIVFYASINLIDWTRVSSFGANHGKHGAGVWECPDLLELKRPDGGMQWVLVVSVSEEACGGGSGTQYFVGQFDGTTFTNVNDPETVLWLDFGRDFYAPQSFHDPHGVPTIMAWASNWSYARETPTEQFRGVASLPRELSLDETPEGLLVAQTIPSAVREAFDARRDRATWRQCFDFKHADGANIAIGFFNAPEAQFHIEWSEEGLVTVHCQRGAIKDMVGYEHQYDARFVWPTSRSLKVEIFVDHGVVELLLADGTASISNVFYPDNVEAPLSLTRTSRRLRGPANDPSFPKTQSQGGPNG